MPGASTSKVMRSSPTRTCDTLAWTGTASAGADAAAERSTRFHSGGPPAARYVPARVGSRNQASDVSSQSFSLPTSRTTTGTLARGCTSPEPATS